MTRDELMRVIAGAVLSCPGGVAMLPPHAADAILARWPHIAGPVHHGATWRDTQTTQHAVRVDGEPGVYPCTAAAGALALAAQMRADGRAATAVVRDVTPWRDFEHESAARVAGSVTVSTVAELESLPSGSVVRDCGGWVAEKCVGWWAMTGDPCSHPAHMIDLPATVLYRPEGGA